MGLTIDEFESITNEAFSFLLSDFGYSATPPEKGGRFSSGFVRKFVKGDLTICFVFGDVGSSHLCSLTFDDGIDGAVQRRYMPRALSILLRDRHPKYVHRTSRDLTQENSIAETILEYGALLEVYATDAIK